MQRKKISVIKTLCSLNYFTVVVILALSVALMGMTSKESSGNLLKASATNKRFNASIVEHDNTAVACEDVDIEGKRGLEGTRGAATYGVPFEKISSISFYHKQEKLLASVTLRDNSTVELFTDKKQSVHGRVSYGNFMIPLSAVKKIIFVK